MIYGIDPRGITRVCGPDIRDVIEAANRYVNHHQDSGPLDLWEFAEPTEFVQPMAEGESGQ